MSKPRAQTLDLKGPMWPPPRHWIQRDAVGKRVVRILLECFLVTLLHWIKSFHIQRKRNTMISSFYHSHQARTPQDYFFQKKKKTQTKLWKLPELLAKFRQSSRLTSTRTGNPRSSTSLFEYFFWGRDID